MESIRRLIVALASAAGGYLGYKLVGDWVGIPFGAAIAGLGTDRLLNDQLAAGAMVLIGGMVGLFYFIGMGGPVAPANSVKDAARKMVAEANLPSVGSPAAGTSTVAVNAAPRPAAELPAIPVTGERERTTKGGQLLKDCAACPDMVVLVPGRFVMGSRSGTATAATSADEAPPHTVNVRGFALGQTAVTRAQFATFVKAGSYVTDAERLGGCFVSEGEQWSFKPQLNWRKPGITQADNHPAVCISWNDATAYAGWLRELTGRSYRLPTEAEREYAARAGSSDLYSFGDTVTLAQANFNGIGAPSGGNTPARKTTISARQFEPNAYGLYNMHGNVSEWVQDCKHDNYNGAPADGSEWSKACVDTRRGLRGGSWVSSATALRSASRAWQEADIPANVIGFRVARDAAMER